jgi:glutamine synthetase
MNGRSTTEGASAVTSDELRSEVESGAVDTVLLVMTDMQGRLMGKRLHAPFFVEEIEKHGAEGCYYLLTVDVDMNPVQGFQMASWDTGYGDFVFKPDMATLRRVPWLERTAMVVADLEWQDGQPVVASPRQILRRQLERLAERGWTANIGSELEFILFRDSYDAAREKRYHDLVPANPYNVDYSIFGTTVVEDVIRPIRLGMAAAGIRVEDSKGECNFGQHEVNFRYSDALSMADNHSIYKNGAKEIAWQHGHALTFMAKYNEREGNSCHIHCSFWDKDGSLFPAEDGHGFSPMFGHFLAGQLAATRELSYLFAPNVNSYKRLVPGYEAPVYAAWSQRNRSALVRVPMYHPGKEQATRCELRCPDPSCNPYLTFAAMLHAGLDGIEHGYECPEPMERNLYELSHDERIERGIEQLPETLGEAIDVFAESDLMRRALGDHIFDRYVELKRSEWEEYRVQVTRWELEKYLPVL